MVRPEQANSELDLDSSIIEFYEHNHGIKKTSFGRIVVAVGYVAAQTLATGILSYYLGKQLTERRTLAFLLSALVTVPDTLSAIAFQVPVILYRKFAHDDYVPYRPGKPTYIRTGLTCQLLYTTGNIFKVIARRFAFIRGCVLVFDLPLGNINDEIITLATSAITPVVFNLMSEGFETNRWLASLFNLPAQLPYYLAMGIDSLMQSSTVCLAVSFFGSLDHMLEELGSCAFLITWNGFHLIRKMSTLMKIGLGVLAVPPSACVALSNWYLSYRFEGAHIRSVEDWIMKELYKGPKPQDEESHLPYSWLYNLLSLMIPVTAFLHGPSLAAQVGVALYDMCENIPETVLFTLFIALFYGLGTLYSEGAEAMEHHRDHTTVRRPKSLWSYLFCSLDTDESAVLPTRHSSSYGTIRL